MTTHDKSLGLTDFLLDEFDREFKTVSKNGRLVPFSVDIILRDLFDSGLDPMQAMQILEDIHPHLYEGIPNHKIIQLINQAFQHHDWDAKFWKRNYLQPIIIEFEDGGKEVFNYKAIKEFLEEQLQKYKYTSKTFKAITEELHRIVLSLRTDKLSASVIDNMVPSVLRNVIGINPFSSHRFDNDYRTIVRLSDSLRNTWTYLPNQERQGNLLSLFESFYRIILLSFNYLPGYNFRSTLTQINQLIADRAERQNTILTDQEVHIIGKSCRDLLALIDEEEPKLELIWLDRIEILFQVIEELIDDGNIKWLIVIDQSGNEIFSRFVAEQDMEYKSLIGMAISGVQSLVNELTDKRIKQIDQDEGSILIERSELFSVVALVEKVTPNIRRAIEQLSDYIKDDLQEELRNFKGDISKLNELLTEYLNSNMERFFQAS